MGVFRLLFVVFILFLVFLIIKGIKEYKKSFKEREILQEEVDRGMNLSTKAQRVIHKKQNDEFEDFIEDSLNNDEKEIS